MRALARIVVWVILFLILYGEIRSMVDHGLGYVLGGLAFMLIFTWAVLKSGYLDPFFKEDP